MAAVDIGPFRIGERQPLVLIAGPCIIESTDHCLMVAETAARICDKLGIKFIFKEEYNQGEVPMD